MTEIRDNLRLSNLELEELNRVLGRVQDRFDELEGRRGSPQFWADVNLRGNRVTGAGAGQDDTDVVNKSQLVAERIPVGWVIISTVADNPADLLGYGTWELWGAGKVIVGLDATDVDFDTVEEAGGAKTADLSHVHTIDHTHGAGTIVDNDGTGSTVQVNDAAHAGDSGSAGSATQSIVQPYIVAYFWKRTA